MGPTVEQWFKQRCRVITDSYVERYMYSHIAYSIRHMFVQFTRRTLSACDSASLREYFCEWSSATRSANTERALNREASAPQRIDGNWFLLLRKIRNRSHPCHRIRCRVIRDSLKADLRTGFFPNFSLAGEPVGFMQRVLGLRQCWIAV